MRRLILATAFTVAAMGASASADAMPALQVAPGDAAVVPVIGGCGPGGHRDPFGRCVPNFRRPFRACPPGFHPNPYGRCRPNF